MTKQQALESGFTHECKIFKNHRLLKAVGINFIPTYVKSQGKLGDNFKVIFKVKTKKFDFITALIVKIYFKLRIPITLDLNDIKKIIA